MPPAFTSSSTDIVETPLLMTMLISGGFSHKKMEKSVEGEGEIRVFLAGSLNDIG
jgi:hypothetical protein